jgi:hypothetical protein
MDATTAPAYVPPQAASRIPGPCDRMTCHLSTVTMSSTMPTGVASFCNVLPAQVFQKNSQFVEHFPRGLRIVAFLRWSSAAPAVAQSLCGRRPASTLLKNRCACLRLGPARRFLLTEGGQRPEQREFVVDAPVEPGTARQSRSEDCSVEPQISGPHATIRQYAITTAEA